MAMAITSFEIYPGADCYAKAQPNCYANADAGSHCYANAEADSHK